MEPVVLFLMLYVPWGPPDHRIMLIRIPEYTYSTPEECEQEAPADALRWLESLEKQGFGAVEVRTAICHDRSGSEPA